MDVSLQDSLSELVRSFPAGFHMSWVSASVILLLVLFGILFVSTSSPEKYKLIPNSVFIALGALAIIICRLPSLCYGESNPDESQWLATAVTIQSDPYLYFSDFYIYDLGRFLTILPLWLFVKFGFEADYGLSKLIGLICWITIFSCYFYLIKDQFGKKVSFIASSILGIFLATLAFYDYIAFNSETVAVMLLSIFFFIYNKTVYSDSKSYLALLAGILLTSTLFAKEQSIYIVIVCGLYCCAAYWLKKDLNKLSLFIGGGLFTIIFALLPVFYFGKFQEFLYLIVQSANYQKSGAGFNNLSFYEKINSIFIDSKSYFYLLSILSFACLLIFSLPRNKIITHFKKISLFLALYVASIYTVTSPHDLFHHYLLFIVLPTAYILAVCIYVISITQSAKILILYSVTIFIFICVPASKQLHKEYHRHLNKVPQKISAFSNEILKYAHPTDKLIVLGWDNRFYVETKLAKGSRYWYSSFLNPIYAPDFTNTVLENYEEDILKYKPEIIIELVGESERVTGISFSLESYPTLKNLINNHYSLVYNNSKKKIYSLKNH